MIVVDTNVVSEVLKPGCDQAVISWLDSQDARTLYLSTISLSELLLGLELLPAGKRRKGLKEGLKELIEKLFGPRLLPFDETAAVVYATLVAEAKATGRAVHALDGQIAAIASAQGFTVASRDTKPFLALGVPTINPWKFR